MDDYKPRPVTGDGVKTRSAWSTGVAVAALLWVLGLPPYAFAWFTTPSQLVYTGLMLDVPDHAQYWSWVTASRDGLFISDTMTPEPNPRIFMNPMMWALGHVQSALGLSFPELFQLWRIFAICVLAAGLVAATRTLISRTDARRTALTVAILGAGCGWILVGAKFIFGLQDSPFERPSSSQTHFCLVSHIAREPLHCFSAAWRAYEPAAPVGLCCWRSSFSDGASPA